MVYVPKPGRGKPDPTEEAFVGLTPFAWRLCYQSEIHLDIDMYIVVVTDMIRAKICMYLTI